MLNSGMVDLDGRVICMTASNAGPVRVFELIIKRSSVFMPKCILSKLMLFVGGLSIFAALSLQADEFIKFSASGELLIDGNVKCQLRHFGPNWRIQAQSEKSVNINEKDISSIAGVFTVKSGEKFDFEESLQKVSKNKVVFDACLKNKDGVETKQLYMGIEIPVGKSSGLIIDGKKLEFPKEYDKMSLFSGSSVTQLVYQLPDYRLIIEGDLNMMVQDNRKFGSESFAIRFNFTPSRGQIKDSSVKLTFKREYFDVASINISEVVNMGFSDEEAEDKIGGWTDQGPANDLRMFKTGKRRFAGISFDIINPEKNNNKSCIVLAGPDREYFPTSVEVEGKDASFKYLYFLHSAAWASSDKIYGTVEVIHNDGSKSEFNVKGKYDVGNWWGSFPVENGAVVWTGENKSSYVGLFMSKFKITDKPISKIKISSTGAAVWMIVGLSGSNEDITLSKEMSENYIIAGKDWQAFDHGLDVEKGSALDMSFLTEAPAGKYGRVIAKDGHFYFEKQPIESVRFYGANLCFGANYLSKEECEQLADRLVAYGYNSIRFHHHDRDLVDKNAEDSLTILDEQMDKLDYLFYCLKRRGIYITTDMFVSRALKASEVKELEEDSRDVKALVPLSDQVMNNIKMFSKKFLNHVNPYTGLAWKDDPALFSISFVNENTLSHIWKKYSTSELAYDKSFKAWVEEGNISIETEDEKASALTQFMINMQIKSYEELKKYVKNDLGCKALYSDCNMCSYISQALARNKFDYVDNHAYWDHPRFPVQRWRFPMAFHNRSVLSKYCSVPCSSMPSRIFGKPFSFTEFNYVFPNEYRSEGNPVIGALAAFQDWDAMYRFAFSHSHDKAVNVKATSGFDVSSDPLTLLGERIVTLMFRRADVKVGQQAVPFLVTPACAEVVGTPSGTGKSFPNEYSQLGLIHRIGSVVAEKGEKLPDNSAFVVSMENINKSILKDKALYNGNQQLIESLLKDNLLSTLNFNLEADTTFSDTGEIALNVKSNTFSVISGRSECFVLPAGIDGNGKVMSVSGNTTFSTIFASSVDGKDLKNSNRILILHLTDIKNTKTKFFDKQHSQLGHIGVLPHLVRKGKANITMNVQETKMPILWAIDVTGKRLEKIKIEKTPKGFSFEINTASKEQSRMAYELIWE
jgi:hypothetical protein